MLSDGVYHLSGTATGGLLADPGVHTFGDLRTGEAPGTVRLVAGGHRQRPIPSPARLHPVDLDSYGIHLDDFGGVRCTPHRRSRVVFEPVRVCVALPGSIWWLAVESFRWRCSDRNRR